MLGRRVLGVGGGGYAGETGADTVVFGAVNDCCWNKAALLLDASDGGIKRELTLWLDLFDFKFALDRLLLKNNGRCGGGGGSKARDEVRGGCGCLCTLITGILGYTEYVGVLFFGVDCNDGD